MACGLQVKAFGPGLQSSGLAVGKPTEFTVDAKHGGKAPLKIVAQVRLTDVEAASNTFSTFAPASWVLQDGEGVPVDVLVKDNANGTYSCSYTPRKPVKHTAMISWGGVNIPNSPFRVSTGSPLHRFTFFPEFYSSTLSDGR